MRSSFNADSGTRSADGFVHDTMAKLRLRLLDLTARNPLLNFRHSSKGGRLVRVIDELPDALFVRLDDDQSFRFKSLGEPESEPADERRVEFRRALEAAKLDDAAYLEELAKAGDDPGGRLLDRLEQELRSRIRVTLGMPPRLGRTTASPEDAARKKGLDPSFDLPTPSAREKHSKHADGFIQTLYYSDQLERCLGSLRNHVRVSLDETGVNPIFCVFGFLEWFEANSSEKPLHAPLLLLPLELEREVVKGHWDYRVRGSGEGAMVNVALAERLKRDFGIELPPLEEEDTPESYFLKVHKAIEPHRNWRVRRWITIGLFSFAKIAMYHDLDPDHWGGGMTLAKHAGIARLLAGEGGQDGAAASNPPHLHGSGSGDTEDVPPPSNATAFDLDRDEMGTPLIADADPSQLDAICTALSGRDLVIEGPPGTGKSQTITNLIAAALARGKTVLFIAEKMAALNVVYSRMQAAGLGDFCFELHSTKAGRKETFASIGRRLARKPVSDVEKELKSVKADMGAARMSLSSFVESLCHSAGALGVTIQELLWKVNDARIKSPDLPREIDDIWLDRADELTEQDVTRGVLAARALERTRREIAAAHGSAARNPWHGIAHPEIGLLDADQLVSLMSALVTSAERAAQLSNDIAASTPWRPERLRSLLELTGVLNLPPPGPSADARVIAALTEPQVRADAESFLARTSELVAIDDMLAEKLGAPATAGTAPALREISTLCRDVGEPCDVSSLPQLTDRANARCQRDARGARALERIRALVEPWLRSGRERTGDVSADAAISEACELAAKADESVIHGRTAELCGEGAHLITARALAQRERIERLRCEAAVDFVLDDCPSSSRLREHARAVRGAPFIPSFSGAYREARRAWRERRRTKTKPSRDTMAGDFDHLAELVAGHESFDADPEIAKVFGQTAKRTVDDCVKAHRVACWAHETREGLRTRVPSNLWACDMLFAADAATMSTLAAFRGSEDFAVAKDLVDLATHTGRSIKDTAEASTDFARRVSSARDKTSAIAIAPHVHVSELPGLADVLDRADALREELESAATITSLISGIEGESPDRARTLQQSVEYVHAVLRWTIPVVMKAWLLESDAAERHGVARRLAASVKPAIDSVTAAMSALNQISPVDCDTWLKAPSVMDVSPDDLAALGARCRSEPGSLTMLIEDGRALREFENERLGPVLGLLSSHNAAPDRLAPACRRVLLQSIVRAALSRHPALLGFSGTRHEDWRQRFRELDLELQRLGRRHITHTLMSRRVPEGSDKGPRNQWTDLALIDHVTKLQRPRTGVRHLLRHASKAVQQLMPCFMMSPLSVAQNLSPDVSFDLVIMDEASQLRPEDAIGAIARGKQVVIVGDPKQLPPTNFFAASQEQPDDEEDFTAADESSILDAAVTVLRPMKRLNWHYRSKHASLIAFSNHEFYDDSLIVFPSPQHTHPEYGVSYVHVKDGCYHRKGRINPVEAEWVARAVLDHARRCPNRSLGVVALNSTQAELLRIEIDRLATEEPVFEAWRQRQEHTLEPFFVKNLESVQGDERDVILISTVYGKDESGNMFQRFGPINSQGGHRRLNVLFTRAKLQTIVMSSMSPEDVRVDEKSGKGVQALQGYLKYARDRVLDRASVDGREPDSEFEIAVAEVLRREGFDVVAQVGVVGYFIDMAVRHPSRPGEYAIGIECDGAMYHSSKSARDRDRLRQEILERLGWKLHRIWSLDWFRSPGKETQRLVAAVRAAVDLAAI